MSRVIIEGTADEIAETIAALTAVEVVITGNGDREIRVPVPLGNSGDFMQGNRITNGVAVKGEAQS